MHAHETRDGIRFVLNGEVVDLRDIDPTTTVLRWLRETRRLTGTKEGCAAGDCGACTVALGHDTGGGTTYLAANACLLPLPLLDGRVVVTVEHLAASDGTLQPVQQAMVDCHGSQCGFCTPGFIMSMATRAWRHDARDATPHDIDDDLSGNLCRCTGYASIRVAARQAQRTPRPQWDVARRAADEALLGMPDVDRIARLDGAGRRAFIPATLGQFAALLAAHPAATIVAGATDIGLWITKQDKAPETMIVTSRLDDPLFNSVGATWIGGGVTHANAMAASLSLFGAAGPAMHEIWRRFAGPQVRNTGTVGGNIANGSPIGDLAPALIAWGATLHLQHGADVRTMPLEDFFIAYGEQDRRPGEFVLGLALPEAAAIFAVHKVSKRFDDDISAACGAFNIAVTDGRISSARIAFGGMAAIPKRAKSVEAALVGKPWSRATIDAALPAFSIDFQPITDMRASSAYRLEVARNLLVRTFIEQTSTPRNTRLVGPNAAFGA